MAVRWVSRLVTALVGLIIVLIPWLAHRLFRVDPLAAPVGDRSHWIPRNRRPDVMRSPFRAEPASVLAPRHRRLRRVVAVPALMIVLVGTTGWLLTRLTAEAQPAAVADLPWWTEYRRTTKWFLDRGFDPIDRPRIRDFRSPMLNVSDGMRRTWRPPACSCQRFTVWMYGGSTTFGMGQRDDHTIASELAKLAWADGIALDVDNRGVPGDVHWVESQSFAWDVSDDLSPDLVLFYDGANDIGAATRNLSTTQPVDPPMADAQQLFQRLSSPFDFLAGPAPDGAELLPTTTLPARQPRQLGESAAATYARGQQVSERTAAAHGIRAHWLWQPTLASRDPVRGEPVQPSPKWASSVMAGALSRLPRVVTDLTGAFDGVEEPVYFDSVHTNEFGASIIARDVYEVIRSDLEELASAGGSRTGD